MDIPTPKKLALLIAYRGLDAAAGVLADASCVLAAASWMAVFGATIATSRLRET